MKSRILGHQHILVQLQALARKNTIAHAYLFTGPSGVGKKTTSLQFAAGLEQGDGESVRPLSDLVLVSPDPDGKIGIEAVRYFHNQLLEQPQQSPYRVGILNDAHRMTPEAQNALLKLAEEPPEHAVLIVIAHDPETLYGTLRSRLQPIVFSPVPEKEVIAWLQEVHSFTKKKAEMYARQAGGRPGLALRLATDETMRALQESAQALLKAAPRERTALIKQLVEEEVSLADILDALIREIAYTVQAEKRFGFWHALLSLRRDAERSGLNTRLQLEALFTQ